MTCPNGHLTGLPAVTHARNLATTAHAGQVDKGGLPYIAHPARVAVTLTHPNWATVTIAWLHDVIEDTPTTLADLADTYCPPILAALDAITRRPHEPATEYYARVSANPWAVNVKHADVADNTNPARRPLDEQTAARLTAKYAATLAALPPLGAPPAPPTCEDPAEHRIVSTSSRGILGGHTHHCSCWASIVEPDGTEDRVRAHLAAPPPPRRTDRNVRVRQQAAQLAAVIALHQPGPGLAQCAHDHLPWPCPTRTAVTDAAC